MKTKFRRMLILTLALLIVASSVMAVYAATYTHTYTWRNSDGASCRINLTYSTFPYVFRYAVYKPEWTFVGNSDGTIATYVGPVSATSYYSVSPYPDYESNLKSAIRSAGLNTSLYHSYESCSPEFTYVSGVNEYVIAIRFAGYSGTWDYVGEGGTVRAVYPTTGTINYVPVTAVKAVYIPA